MKEGVVSRDDAAEFSTHHGCFLTEFLSYPDNETFSLMCHGVGERRRPSGSNGLSCSEIGRSRQLWARVQR